jgi:hypothetical protein
MKKISHVSASTCLYSYSGSSHQHLGIPITKLPKKKTPRPIRPLSVSL